jgi:hypothetical protein
MIMLTMMMVMMLEMMLTMMLVMMLMMSFVTFNEEGCVVSIVNSRIPKVLTENFLCTSWYIHKGIHMVLK